MAENSSLGRNASLCRRIISAYRGWHDWVLASKGYDAAKLIVVDDLAPPAPAAPFDSREEVEAAFEELLAEAASWKDSRDSYLRYSYGKLAQSLAYVRQSSDLPGGLDGVAARGGRWLRISDEELEEMRERLRAIRAARAPGEPNPDELVANADAPGLIRERAERWLPRLRELLPGLEEVKYRVQPVNEPAPWRNMVVNDGKGFVLQVNTASSVRYTRADAEYFALHEVCGHVVHLSRLERSREVLTRAPHLLCVSIHTRDAWLTEGVAQTLSEFITIEEPTNSPARGAVLTFDLLFAVFHRNVVDLLEGTVSPAVAAKRHADHIPGGPDRTAFYERIAKDPFYACQALVYATSRRDFAPALKALSAAQSRAEAFRRLTENVFVPDELTAV